MFRPGIEALYFANHQEAIDKLQWLLSEPERIETIASAGYKKVLAGPYQLHHRVDQILNIAKNKIARNNEKKKITILGGVTTNRFSWY
jgi:spore maturation protein CgeB